MGDNSILCDELSSDKTGGHSSEYYVKKDRSIQVKQTTELPRTGAVNDCGTISGTNKEVVALKSCPLCQMEFDSRFVYI